MPLIKKPDRAKADKQFRVRMEEALLQEVESYCSWADLPSKDYFLGQAAIMALKKDKEWLSVKKKLIEKHNLVD